MNFIDLITNLDLESQEFLTYANRNEEYFQVYITSLYPKPAFHLIKLALRHRNEITFDVIKVIHNVFKNESPKNIILLFDDDLIPLDYCDGLPLALAKLYHEDIFVRLLERGANLNLALDKLFDMIPQTQSCEDMILDFLKDHGFDFNTNLKSLTLLCYSVSKVEYLIKNGVKLETLDYIIPKILTLDEILIRYLIEIGISATTNHSIFLDNISNAELCLQLLDLGCDPLSRRAKPLMLCQDRTCRDLLWSKIKDRQLSVDEKILLYFYSKRHNLEFGMLSEQIPVSHLVFNPVDVCDLIGRSGEDDYISLVSDGESKIDFLYSIFDGHAGQYRQKRTGKVMNMRHIVYAAKYGGNILPLHHYIEIYLDIYSDVVEAIQKAFISFDTDAYYLGYEAGSCVTMLMSICGILYSVNLGDSRIVITDGENLLYETQDHEPDFERQRIEAAGGYVAKNRVCGELAVSRALLDPQYKGYSYDSTNGYVIAIPDVVKLNLPSGPKTAIISSDAPYTKCDGFYSSSDMIRKFKMFESVEELGCDIRRFSTDDITVMIVALSE